MATILTLPSAKSTRPFNATDAAEELICDIGACLNDLCNLPISAVVKARISYMGGEISAEEALKRLLMEMMTMTHFTEEYRLGNER